MRLNVDCPEQAIRNVSRPLLILLALLLLSGCELFSGKEAHVHSSQIFAFGTIVEISHYTNDENLVHQAVQKAEEDFLYMHEAWHPYQPGPLARINSLLPTGSTFSIAPSVRPLIIKGKELEKLSEGFFNPAIGRLIQLWGFDRMETSQTSQPPDVEKIQLFLKHRPGMGDIKLDGLNIKGNNPEVFLDFGGFAKGYGIDRVIEELQKIGVKNIIVNAGGDLRAIGSKGGKPWNIGIRHPRNNDILASLSIQGDESVFTSGDYERYFEFQQRRYHHILNPFSGMPATDFQSVTIVNRDAAMADAASTALFVAGKENWKRVAKKMGVDQVMLVDQQGKVMITKKLKQRIEFNRLDENAIEVIDSL